jgi:hypothetical protein
LTPIGYLLSTTGKNEVQKGGGGEVACFKNENVGTFGGCKILIYYNKASKYTTTFSKRALHIMEVLLT